MCDTVKFLQSFSNYIMFCLESRKLVDLWKILILNFKNIIPKN